MLELWVWCLFILALALYGIVVATNKLYKQPFSWVYLAKLAGWLYFAVVPMSHVWHLLDEEVSLQCPDDTFFLSCPHPLVDFVNSYQVAVLLEVLFIFVVIAWLTPNNFLAWMITVVEVVLTLMWWVPGLPYRYVYDILTLVLSLARLLSVMYDAEFRYVPIVEPV